MSPKRDTSQKRHEILDAAIREFQAVGYDNTSMDRIAESAGASKRTVYNHFASKELLFQAAFESDNLLSRGLTPAERAQYRDLHSKILEIMDVISGLAKAAAGSNAAHIPTQRL